MCKSTNCLLSPPTPTHTLVDPLLICRRRLNFSAESNKQLNRFIKVNAYYPNEIYNYNFLQIFRKNLTIVVIFVEKGQKFSAPKWRMQRNKWRSLDFQWGVEALLEMDIQNMSYNNIQYA